MTIAVDFLDVKQQNKQTNKHVMAHISIFQSPAKSPVHDLPDLPIHTHKFRQPLVLKCQPTDVPRFLYYNVPKVRPFNSLHAGKFFMIFGRLLIFFKLTFLKNCFRNIFRVSNSLETDQV